MTDSKLEETSYPEPYTGYDFDPTYYDPTEIDDDLGRSRTQDADERTSWGYLGALGIIFLALIGFAWGCEATEDDDPLPEVVDDETGATVAAPVRLNIEVEGDIVTIRGAVPDEAARGQLISLVESIYSSANLIDELTVDPETTLEAGSIAVSGVATVDDDRPVVLRDAIVEDFGLEDGGVTVERREDAVLSVSVDAFIENDTVRLSGALPDQASIDDLTAAAQAAWGANAVDSSGLITDDRTWTDGQIRVTGTAPAGDTSHQDFATEVTDRFGSLVTVDVSGVAPDLNPEALAAIEAEIQEEMQANPILFAPQSAELDPSSDVVLQSIAERLIELPEITVEVIGHTDDLGPDDENLVLSQQRADAVKARLIELGVEESRLNARGEGEQFPLVPNDSAENRELNRRIEFDLLLDDQ